MATNTCPLLSANAQLLQVMTSPFAKADPHVFTTPALHVSLLSPVLSHDAAQVETMVLELLQLFRLPFVFAFVAQATHLSLSALAMVS
jgi:hypothetical protein